jgi:hypothetical protein
MIRIDMKINLIECLCDNLNNENQARLTVRKTDFIDFDIPTKLLLDKSMHFLNLKSHV